MNETTAPTADSPTLRTTTRDFPAKFTALNEAMIALDDQLRGLPERAAFDLRLACEELFLNIINYAYPSYAAHTKGRIEIVWVDDPVARKTFVTFTDTGIPFNPLTHPRPKLDTDVFRRRVGGLGIMLIRDRLSDLEYNRIDDKNVFSFTRNWDE